MAGLLRFIACGSVDDGKSTLIGRLLHDGHAVPDDQMAAVAADSRIHGTQGEATDLALLVDGLAAEREQGVTIDVAWRHFSTPQRRFIIADAPGHEQYTRNMVTGASTADLAVVLIDARKGVLAQTRRHTIIAALLGVRQVVLAVNKMDLVGWSEDVFRAIADDYGAFARASGIEAVTAIPLSALTGDNVVARGETPSWWDGPTLLAHLEAAPVEADAARGRPFRMAVQWVCRPDPDFRGYAGRVASGGVRPGQPVRILPSGRTTSVGRIVGFKDDEAQAPAGQSVMLTLADAVDVARGDVIVAADDPPEVADQFRAALVWMAEEPLLPGRSYLMKTGARTVPAQVTSIRHGIDVETLAEIPLKSVGLNGVAVCNIALAAPVPFEPYAVSRELGGFILIDRTTNATVGAGMIRHALRRAANIHRQALTVTREARAAAKGQKAAVVWFTGLSGAGKSAIADRLEKRLQAEGRHAFILDGDNLRHGLNRDLGFTEADRVENIRRAAEVAKLMTDAGLIVLASFISPFRAERAMAREMMAEGEFIEVFVDTPLDVAEARDPKGLYAKARRGALSNFTGVDSPYEPPENPDIHIRTVDTDIDDACDRVMAALRDGGFLA